MKAVIRFSTNWQDEIDFHITVFMAGSTGAKRLKIKEDINEK